MNSYHNTFFDNKGDATLYILIIVILLGGLFLSGGIFNSKLSNQIAPGAYVPLSPSPDNSQKTLQLHSFKFLYLTPTPTPGANSTGNGGKNIIWLNSFTHGEFDPHFTDWVWSQCSQASFAEVLNAYKNPGDTLYRIEEVEARALSLGVWDQYLGFLGPFAVNWKKEGAAFGFDVNFQWYDTTQQNLGNLIAIANQGHPVIVGAPMHYLVLWGGDSQYVYLLDSSGHDFTWAPQSSNDSIHLNGPHQSYKPTRAEFIHGLGGFANYWDGIGIVATPHG